MDGLVGTLIESIGQLIERYWPWLVAAAVALIIGCVALYFLVQAWGMYRDSRGIFKATAPYYFKQKKKLLRNSRLREAFAPFDRFVDELDEGAKRPWKLPAFLHPYPRAVLAAGADHRMSGRKVFDARAQITELAKWISVGPLPEWVPEKPSRDTYWIELGKTGDHTDEQLEGFKGFIKNTLRVKSVEPYPDKNDNVVSFIVRVKEIEDPLENLRPGAEFFEENPAPDMRHLPLAVDSDGQPWVFSLFHTLIFGTSGSGKGSPLQGIIRQLGPFVAKRLVKLFMIDPKGSEAEAYASPQNKTPMLERISMGPNEEDLRGHVKTVALVAAELDRRIKNKKVNIDRSQGAIELGRKFRPSRSNPMVVLIIDEYFAFRTNLITKLKHEAKVPLADLDTILAMGRSYGIFVIIATQYADKENLGPIRDNLGNKIVLRHDTTDYITTFLLGEDALELGHNPKAIPQNDEKTNKTAGIGFVRDEMGNVQKVRFAYLSDDEIADYAFNFRMEDEDSPEPETPSGSQPDSESPSSSQHMGLPRFSSIQQRQMDSSEW